MEVILKMGQEEFSISRNIDNPDTDNVMYALEMLIEQASLDKAKVEEYVLAWAEEIKSKK